MRGRLSINQSARTVPGVLRQGRSEVLRLKGVFMIHQLREQGLTVSEIARRMRVDRKTVLQVTAARSRATQVRAEGAKAAETRSVSRLPAGAVGEVPAAQRDAAAA